MSDIPIIRKGARVTAAPTAGRLTALISKTLLKESPLRRRRLFAGDAAFCSRSSATFCLVDEDLVAPQGVASAFYFANGNSSHEVIERAFEEAGVLVKAELNIPDIGINLGGRIDNVIMLDGEYVLVEVKTCGALPSKPKPQHQKQLETYLMATGIQRGILYYISRNVAGFDGALKSIEFEISPTEDDLANVAYNACVSYFSSISGKQPPIPPHITSRSHCGWCPFISSCWDGSVLKGVEQMNSAEFTKVHETSMSHASRLMRTITARRIKSQTLFKQIVADREREKKEDVKSE